MSLVALEVVTCLFMTGVIWIVQWVHYPAFFYIDRAAFSTFSVFHSRRISHIVMPVMVVEMVVALTLLFTDYHWVWWINAALLIGTWLSTFLFSVPIHSRLAHGYSEHLVNRLVATNWPRTVLWTARSLLLLYFA